MGLDIEIPHSRLVGYTDQRLSTDMNSPWATARIATLKHIRLLAVDRLMQDDLCNKSSIRTAVAGCYTCYRGDCLMQTVSVQFYWDHWL